MKIRVWDSMHKRLHVLENADLRLDNEGAVKFVFGEDFNDDFTAGTEPYEIMHETGLIDVAGIEIFEGDIVELEKVTRSVVVFLNGCAWVEDLFGGVALYRIADKKVVGNIYEK